VLIIENIRPPDMTQRLTQPLNSVKSQKADAIADSGQFIRWRCENYLNGKLRESKTDRFAETISCRGATFGT
jgi:hypothetical protein